MTTPLNSIEYVIRWVGASASSPRCSSLIGACAPAALPTEVGEWRHVPNQRIIRMQSSLKNHKKLISRAYRREHRRIATFFIIAAYNYIYLLISSKALRRRNDERGSANVYYLAPPHRGVFTPPPKVFWTPPQDKTPQWGYTRPPMGVSIICKCSASVNNPVNRQLI